MRFSIVGGLTAIALVVGGCGATRFQLTPSDGPRGFSVRVTDELVDGWLTLVDEDDPAAGCVLHLRSNVSSTLALGWSEAAMVGPDHRAHPLEFLSSAKPALLEPRAHLTLMVRAPGPLAVGDQVALTLPVSIDGNVRTYHFRARLVPR